MTRAPGPGTGGKAERDKRLAEALKANLKRRKAQGRADAAGPAEALDTAGDDAASAGRSDSSDTQKQTP